MLINPYVFVRPWTPAQITTALWLDANDSGTLTTTSNAVSQWNDKSGNGRNASQSTATNMPTFTPSSLNGLSVVRFDATNDFMSLSSASGLTTATQLAVYAVRRSSVASAADVITNRSILVGTGGTYNLGASVTGVLSGETTVFIVGPDSTSFSPRVGANSSTYNIGANQAEIYHVYGTSSNGDYGARVNGSAITTFLTFDALGRMDPAGCNPALTGFNIGGSGAASNSAVVDFAEIIVLTSNPSLATSQLIEGYLAWKWGLTANLPSGHPYKSSRPTI